MTCSKINTQSLLILFLISLATNQAAFSKSVQCFARCVLVQYDAYNEPFALKDFGLVKAASFDGLQAKCFQQFRDWTSNPGADDELPTKKTIKLILFETIRFQDEEDDFILDGRYALPRSSCQQK